MNVLSLSTLVIALFAATTEQPQPTPRQTGIEAEISETVTTIKWAAETKNLGEIEQGKPVTVYFELENSGDVPLIITNVKTSCGCTVSDYEKDPILPGESSKIKAVYNAKAKGAFHKTITVYANTKAGTKLLMIKGKVI